jgi:hypothetical protein
MAFNLSIYIRIFHAVFLWRRHFKWFTNGVFHPFSIRKAQYVYDSDRKRQSGSYLQVVEIIKQLQWCVLLRTQPSIQSEAYAKVLSATTARYTPDIWGYDLYTECTSLQRGNKLVGFQLVFSGCRHFTFNINFKFSDWKKIKNRHK